MQEGWLVLISVIVAGGLALLIHRTVMAHGDISTDRRAILSMEILLLSMVFSGFILAEVYDTHTLQNWREHFIGDAARLFGALITSFGGYKLLKWL